MEQEFAIGWGTLALLNAGLARCMNRDGLGWFSVSIFGGPIATFCLVILGPIAPNTNTETKTDRRHRGRGDEGFPL
jgi:hypothetical protein